MGGRRGGGWGEGGGSRAAIERSMAATWLGTPVQMRRNLRSAPSARCVLQCVAVCCGVLRCVAVWCSVGQCGAVWGSKGQCGAVWGSDGQ